MPQNNLGLEHEYRGQIEEAFVCYRDALRWAANPMEEATVRNNLGNLYLSSGDPQAAAEQFVFCLELNHLERGLYYNNLGLAFSDLGDPTQAERMYLMSLDAEPLRIETYLNYGVLCFRQERWDLARKLLDRAAGINPDHRQAVFALGKFYISRGEFAQAAQVFRRFVSEHPWDREGYLYLAISSLRTASTQSV